MPDKTTFKAQCTIMIKGTIDDEKITESFYINGVKIKEDFETFNENFTREDVAKKLEDNAGSDEKFAAFVLKSLKG